MGRSSRPVILNIPCRIANYKKAGHVPDERLLQYVILQDLTPGTPSQQRPGSQFLEAPKQLFQKA